MMASQVARQFCRLREVHRLVYGRRAGSKNGGETGRKPTAGARAGSQSLMNHLGLNHSILKGIVDTLTASRLYTP